MVQRIQAFSLTDPGRKRANNQDACAVFSKGEVLLMVVADGVGGNKCGEIASSLTVQTLRSAFERGYRDPETFLAQAVREANRKIREYVSTHPECQGMATTLTSVVVKYPDLYLLHVGDSRAYLLREGSFQRLTEDHTLVERMRREGVLTPEEARDHPKRHVIVNAVGISEEQKYDLRRVDLSPGDKVLLCSDGLYDEVEESVMQTLLLENHPKEAVRELIEAANAAGGRDNISVALASLEGEGLADTKRLRSMDREGGRKARFLRLGVVLLCILFLCGGAWIFGRSTVAGQKAKAYLAKLFKREGTSLPKRNSQSTRSVSRTGNP